MKLKLYLFLLCFTLANFASIAQDTLIFKAQLSGRQQVLPVTTPATGTITVQTIGNQMILSGAFSKLTSAVIEDQTHIHLGFAGQEGAVVFGLIATLSDDGKSGLFDPALNTFSISDEQLKQLQNRQFYVNVHTTNHPSGEIRGQLLPDAMAYFSANLFGSNEVPAVISQGSGSIMIEVKSPTEWVLSGSFQNLGGDFDASIGGGAHLHIGLPNENGEVSVPINVTMDESLKSGVFLPDSNTFQVSTDQLITLGERKLYANIHTTTHSGGELRGQLIPAEASNIFRTRLSGTNTIPATISKGNGILLAEIYSDTLMVVSGGFDELGSAYLTNDPSQIGIFSGIAGEDGGLTFPFNLTTRGNNNAAINATNNVFLLNENQANRLYSRGFYINVSSINFPNGEIRGQLLPEGQVFMSSFLTGTLAVPASKSTGYGNIQAELNGNQLTISGAFNGLDNDFTDTAQIHLGVAGENGVAIFDLNAATSTNPKIGSFQSADNTFELRDEQVATLLNRSFYIEIPTGEAGQAEIRGQILPEANAYFVSTLSGQSLINGINTDANGQVILEITKDVITATGSFYNLSSATIEDNSIQLFRGLAGQVGNSFIALNPILNGNNSGRFTAQENTFETSEELLEQLASRSIYLNIPTSEMPEGEIRGQFLPQATAYYTSRLSSSNHIPLISNNGVGQLKADLVGNLLTITGAFANLAQAATDSSITVHIGQAGELGSVAFTLKPSLSENGDRGTLEAADNQFTLTNEQLTALKAERLYVQLRTSSEGGAIRGQLLPEPNKAPTGSIEITVPVDGQFFLSSGDPTSPLRLRWLQPEDSNPLYYIYQISTFNDFRLIEEEGLLEGVEENEVNYMLGDLDRYLAARGVEVGDTLQRYYRLIASDGSLQSIGKGNLISIVRGEVERILGADLELSATTPEGFYEIFNEVPYRITVTNKGPQVARNIVVKVPIPNGMAYTSASASTGRYNTFFQWWNFSELAVGDTAVLDLTLFTLIEGEPITSFIEIIGGTPLDNDSTPDNGEAPIPREDDEAVVTITSAPVITGGDTADVALTLELLDEAFIQFGNARFLLTLTNSGPDSVANVKVSALIPEGMAFTSAVASHGAYGVVTQDWIIPFLQTGESATLELTLFSLIEGRPLTLFAQVTESDQFDPDSTPANDLDGIPDEDDEALATILPEGGVMGGDSSDLELSISVDNEDYAAFNNFIYTITITNKGPGAASNIFVDAPLPDSLAFTSKAASIGDWNNFFQFWFIPYLESGASHTLKLNLFTLSRETPISFFVQVQSVDQGDPDSVPNNNTTGVPAEDDEAVFTFGPSNSSNAPNSSTYSRTLIFGASVYPVPANDIVHINLSSEIDMQSDLILLDWSGKVVNTSRLDLSKGRNQISLPIDDLTDGIYHIVLSNSKTLLRFVKISN